MAVGSFIFVVFRYYFISLFYCFFILFVFFILLFLCSVFKWLGERKRGKLNNHFKPIKIALYSPFLRTFEMFIKALWKMAFAFFSFRCCCCVLFRKKYCWWYWNFTRKSSFCSATLMAREVGIVLAWWYLVQAVITLLIQENQLTCMS